MSDREPVNIMGVFAFPNPDEDQRMIRFIDSEYHVLFTIQDGESIVITRFDGEKLILPCTYIDDSHTRIGGFTYHIREFAEMQGATVISMFPQRRSVATRSAPMKSTKSLQSLMWATVSDLIRRPRGSSRLRIIGVLTPVCLQRKMRWNIFGQSTTETAVPLPVRCVPCP